MNRKKHRQVIQLVAMLCFYNIFISSHADCIGGKGTNDIVISNKPTDFYSSGDVVDCFANSSITLGPAVTIPSGAIFNLNSPETLVKEDVYVLAGGQLHILTQIPVLNDTGIVDCADDDANDLACPVASYPGQDAEYGRDSAQDNDSDGHAGFSFTKLDANGKALSSNASIWSCVKDNITGLTWEVKTIDGSLQDKDNYYSWYNSDNNVNGGNAGFQNNGSCTGSDCDTQSYVQAVNTQGLCGAKDWRMPTAKELENIASLNRIGPAIDTAYFPNTNTRYWSGSAFANGWHSAWRVNFDGGYSESSGKRNPGFIRLVRDG